MVKSFFSVLFILFVSVLYGQNTRKDSTHPLKPIACDCKKALKLTLGWNSKYGPTNDTKGFGDIQEIPVKDKHSKYYFETEHHSAWYLLKMNTEGELVFDIVPADPTNDYDFLLFKYTDTSFCRDFLARKLIPVRSNISRVSDEDSGKTGLSTDAKVEYETRGKGFSYSKSIHVKKGEQYMLVLDNVYDSGKGHTIRFHILRDFNFSGKVIDDDSMPLGADISVMRKDGSVIATSQSDNKTGEYSVDASLQIGENYTLMYSSSSTFFDINPFKATIKLKDTIKNKPKVLAKLKDSTTYKLKNILFVGDSARVLGQSIPTLMGLYAIMIIHKHMTIRIEGHVNPVGGKSVAWEQRLSESRALTVFQYLVDKGISRERLSIIGFGDKYPLFPPDDQRSELNRRVEIRVISLGE